MRDMGPHGSPDPHYMTPGETLWDLTHLLLVFVCNDDLGLPMQM